MPLTAMEAQSCARPVVAFRTGGLVDIVDHNTTGYLAIEGNVQDLAQGLLHALDSQGTCGPWGENARTLAVNAWSSSAVVDQYLDVYGAALT